MCFLSLCDPVGALLLSAFEEPSGALQVARLARGLGPRAALLEAVVHQHLPIFHTGEQARATLFAWVSRQGGAGPCEGAYINELGSSTPQAIYLEQAVACTAEVCPCSAPQLPCAPSSAVCRPVPVPRHRALRLLPLPVNGQQLQGRECGLVRLECEVHGHTMELVGWPLPCSHSLGRQIPFVSRCCVVLALLVMQRTRLQHLALAG